MKEKIEKLIEEITGKKAVVETPANLAYGDYATNVAIKEKLNPQELASKLKESGLFEKVEVVNGFINFYLPNKYWQDKVKEILDKKEKFGQLNIGQDQKANVEFISANPTGPLTLGNGRGGFCGDVLANVLSWAGYTAKREYYVNDRGEQIKKLGHSVIGDEQAVYKGDYIETLRGEMKPKQNDNPEKVGEKASGIILSKMIKPTVEKMAIKFDKWFSEKELYKKKEVEKAINFLKEKGLTYEKEGALWFQTTNFGDDKDRVLIKADGEYTYFASDVAYTKNKFDRGFNKLVWFLGADHYGYVARMQAVVEALGYKKTQAIFVVMQLVRLFEDGKEKRMSKREGVYVTLDELIDEVTSANPLGLDAIRYFFLSRGPNTHLNFDLELAKAQTEKNPVFYIQYAYARMNSILEKAKVKTAVKLDLLNHASELKLIKQLAKLGEVIEQTSIDYQVARLTQYATDIASDFHRFYTDCRVIDEENKDLTQSRLYLVKASSIVLKNTLDIMGITAPKKM